MQKIFYISIYLLFFLGCNTKQKVIYPSEISGLSIMAIAKDSIISDVLKVRCKIINNSKGVVGINNTGLKRISSINGWPWHAFIYYVENDTIWYSCSLEMEEPCIPNKDDYVIINNDGGTYEKVLEIDFKKLVEYKIEKEYYDFLKEYEKFDSVEYNIKREYFNNCKNNDNVCYGNYYVIFTYYDRFARHKKALKGLFISNELKIKFVPSVKIK